SVRFAMTLVICTVGATFNSFFIEPTCASHWNVYGPAASVTNHDTTPPPETDVLWRELVPVQLVPLQRSKLWRLVSSVMLNWYVPGDPAFLGGELEYASGWASVPTRPVRMVAAAGRLWAPALWLWARKPPPSPRARTVRESRSVRMTHSTQ